MFVVEKIAKCAILFLLELVATEADEFTLNIQERFVK